MDTLMLHTRRRVATDEDRGKLSVSEQSISLDPLKTAAIICDMWDAHWCVSATARVAELAPRMNELVSELRRRGMLIIHAPSNTMEFYKDHPGRKLAQNAPHSSYISLHDWKNLDLAKEAPLPIDDSDGGCDCSIKCSEDKPWTRQIEVIDVVDTDAITDNAEAIHLMRARGIENVIMMGVAVNMCVLGRPFGIRQLVEQGFQTLLVRDMTDSMYNPQMPPHVDHDAGTELVIQHVEEYWCPTITSDQLI
jgi:nicotinamidase-related amidase